MKKPKPILSEAESKLFKSAVFAVVAMAYGMLAKLSNSWLVTIVFGVLLWMYLREIYGEGR